MLSVELQKSAAALNGLLAELDPIDRPSAVFDRTRANKRSPWDTLHKGRNWASGDGQKDKKSPEQIRNEIKEHYGRTTIYSSFEDVFAASVSGLKQTD